MYLITTRNGIKIVVKTTLRKPTISDSKFWTNNGTKPDFELLKVANEEYSAHLASLPAIVLPESLQHLPVGSEVEGREQWQVVDRSTSEWVDCTRGIYLSRYETGRRIILVADEQGKKEHPESKCQSCGGFNPVWSANNELWNKVNGSPDGIICPTCFIKKANDMGFNMFGLAPQPAEDWVRVEALLKEIDTYLREEHFEKGKPVYRNNIGAFSILHKKIIAFINPKTPQP